MIDPQAEGNKNLVNYGEMKGSPPKFRGKSALFRFLQKPIEVQSLLFPISFGKYVEPANQGRKGFHGFLGSGHDQAVGARIRRYPHP